MLGTILNSCSSSLSLSSAGLIGLSHNDWCVRWFRWQLHHNQKKKKSKLIPVISALRRLRQGDHKFKTILRYIRLYFKRKGGTEGGREGGAGGGGREGLAGQEEERENIARL